MAKLKALLDLCLIFAPLAAAQYSFTSCQDIFESIIAGNYTMGDINNETVWQYIYTGPVYMLKDSFPRNQYFAITYQGEPPNLVANIDWKRRDVHGAFYLAVLPIFD
jgi:hypothetical protein